ncbi:tetraacyldisaccharide 4'-kinase [Candidatus Pelagibacter sp.]|nr:tetraacyldisaccharide 4'-kinase [Candidatus Pelagibacter sp.]
MNFKKPNFWDLPKPNIISYLLIPFSLPIIMRNFFSQFFKRKKSPKIKTICVGNIYVGGTGKTPLTIKLYEILKKFNNKIATVKKDYPNQRDEQILLKKKTSLIISKSRSSAIKEGINENFKILIFDDGLQDLKVDYDLKFACFKSKNWIGNGLCIPAGPMREKISSLKRFDAVFLNGNSNNFENIYDQIKNTNPNILIFKTLYKILNIDKYDLNLKYLIFSGIGNPIDFKNILLENKFNVAKEITFPDHFNYGYKDIEKIIEIAKKGNFKVITTEKDYMKIPDKFKKDIEYLSIDLLIKNEDELISLLKKFL